MKKLTVLILFVLPMMMLGQNPSGMLRSAIFDFEIGDEFQFINETDGYAGDSAFLKKIVINKWNYTDSVCYEFDVEEITRPFDLVNYQRTNSVSKDCYGKLSELMNDSVRADSIKQAAFFGRDIYCSYYTSQYSFDKYTYATGLGEIVNFYHHQIGNDVFHNDLRMVYYSKSSETAGTPLDFTVSTHEIVKDISHTVQNNSMIFIENIEVVNVFNLQGLVVFSDKNTLLVNLNDLNTGIYLISISDGKSISTIKFSKN